MNIKKFSKNKNTNKISITNKGSPNLKENINSKYLSLLKNNKKVKTPLKEQSKNSALFNSPSSNISEDKNMRIKKFKDSLDDKITVQNKKTTTSGKIINNNFKADNNIIYGSPNSNRIKVFNRNNFQGSPKKIIPGSPNSSIPHHLIKDILSPKNYKGKFKTLVDGRKITEYCIGNDKKKSKYYIIEDENIISYAGSWDKLRGVCSKCAVKFANSGILCEEVIENLIDLRKNRLNNFETNFKNLKILINNNYSSLIYHSEKVKSKQEEQILIVNKNIDNIINSLTNFKDDIEHYINDSYNKELEGIDKVVKEFKKFNNEIETYHSDIENNYDIIINKEFKQVDFHKILSKYENRVDNIFNFNEEINEMKSQIPIIEKGKFSKIFNNLKNSLFIFNDFELSFENNCELKNNNNLLNNNYSQELEGEISEIKKHNEDDKSDIIISFDEKNYQNKMNMDKEKISLLEDDKSEKNGEKYIQILDKITSSQKNKNEFYSSFIKKNKDESEFKTSKSNNLENDKNKEINNSDENLYVFVPNNDEDLINKNTPGFGEKDELPESLQIILDKDKEDNKISKCHKVLFN